MHTTFSQSEINIVILFIFQGFHNTIYGESCVIILMPFSEYSITLFINGKIRYCDVDCFSIFLIVATPEACRVVFKLDLKGEGPAIFILSGACEHILPCVKFQIGLKVFLLESSSPLTFLCQPDGFFHLESEMLQ